MKKCFFSYNK